MFVGGGDYHVQDGSDALDHSPDPTTFTADPCTDLEGGPRWRDYEGLGNTRMDIGAYEHINGALVPGEVMNLEWSDKDTLTWDPEPAATSYHIYRDDISTLSYSHFGTCFGTVTDTQLVDMSTPNPDEGRFYVVTGDDGSREGTLGFASCIERSNFTPCP